MNRRRADCGGGKRTQLAQAFSERDVWIDGTVLTRGKGMHCNSTTPEPYSTVQNDVKRLDVGRPKQASMNQAK